MKIYKCVMMYDESVENRTGLSDFCRRLAKAAALEGAGDFTVILGF